MRREGHYELVDGELLEKRMGYLSTRVASRVNVRLGGFVESHGTGEVSTETTFQCFQHAPSRVRRPDVAFIAASRAATISDEGHVRVRPDLIVEILSPTDNHYEVDRRIADYRAVGVPLMWLVNPEVRTVLVLRRDGTAHLLDDDDLIDGGEVVPGFSVRVGEFFPPAGVVPTSAD